MTSWCTLEKPTHVEEALAPQSPSEAHLQKL